MRDQSGVSLVEVMVVMLFVALGVGISVGFSLSWLNEERMRSAVRHVSSHLKLTQAEALKRNRACRFTVDTSNRRIQVLDLNDETDANDDVVLEQVDLDPRIDFAQPDGSSAITFDLLSGTVFEVTFTGEGTLPAGASGEIALRTEDKYQKIQLFLAGGIQLQHWDGYGWREGA